ncbi:conserved hypothetical protein, partial [Ixodes scapularis]
ESAQAKRRSRDESALSRTTNRDEGSEDKTEVEPDVTEPEVEPLVEPEVERETQESANQDKRLEDSNEVEAGAENQESALLSGVIDSGDAEGEPGLEPGDKLASEPENKVADESGVASVGNKVANAAAGYDRKSKKKGDKGARRSKEDAGEGNIEVEAADEGQDVKQSSLETTTGESAAGNLSADDERSEDEAVRSHSASQALGDSAKPVKDNENNSGEANVFKESAGRTLEKSESRSEDDIMLNEDENDPAAVGIGETGPDAENDEAPGDEPTGLVEEQPAMLDAEDGHEATHKNVTTVLDDVDDQSTVQNNDAENSHETKTSEEQGGSAEEHIQVTDAELKQHDDMTPPNLEDSDGQEKNRFGTPAEEDITHQNVQKAEDSQFTSDGIVVTDKNIIDNEDEGKEELERGISSDNKLDPHNEESSSRDKNNLESSVNAEEPRNLGNNADETPSLNDSITPTQNFTEQLDPTSGSPTHADVRNFTDTITDEQVSQPEAVVSDDLHSETSPKEDVEKGVFRDDRISFGTDDAETNNAAADQIELVSSDGDQEDKNLRTGNHNDEDTNIVASEGEAAQNKNTKDLAGTNVGIGGEQVETDADTTGAEDSLVTEENKLAKSFSQDQEPSYLANMIASTEHSTDSGADESPEIVDVAKEGGSQTLADGGNITTLGESQVTADDISAEHLEERVAEELVMPQDKNMLYKVNERTSKNPDRLAVDDGENTESGEDSVPNNNENNGNEDVLIPDELKPQTEEKNAVNLPNNEQCDDLEALSPSLENSATNDEPDNSDKGEVVAQSGEHTDSDILLKDQDDSSGNPTSELASNIENTKAQSEGDEATAVIGEGS